MAFSCGWNENKSTFDRERRPRAYGHKAKIKNSGKSFVTGERSPNSLSSSSLLKESVFVIFFRKNYVWADVDESERRGGRDALIGFIKIELVLEESWVKVV